MTSVGSYAPSHERQIAGLPVTKLTLWQDESSSCSRMLAFEDRAKPVPSYVDPPAKFSARNMLLKESGMITSLFVCLFSSWPDF